LKRLLKAKSKKLDQVDAEIADRVNSQVDVQKQLSDLIQSHLLLSKRVDAILSGKPDPATPKEIKANLKMVARMVDVKKLLDYGEQLKLNVSDGIPTDVKSGWSEL
jgi:hypothetical protein